MSEAKTIEEQVQEMKGVVADIQVDVDKLIKQIKKKKRGDKLND